MPMFPHAYAADKLRYRLGHLERIAGDQMKPVSATKVLGAVLLIVVVMLGYSSSAMTDDANPLRPADTSSPRATLDNFVTSVDGVYLAMHDLLLSYARSGRLYLNAEERAKQAQVIPGARAAVQSLDISRVLPVLKTTVTVERVIQLKEILDRIEVPALEDIPN